MRKPTKEQKRDIRAIAAKRDEDLNFSDAPAVVDRSGAEVPPENPFAKYVGALPTFSGVHEVNAWIQTLRDEETQEQ